MPTVAEVVAALDRAYPPSTAADWDAVGPVCGDPGAPVRRVLLAVDPVLEVADEAVQLGADLLLTHHPLFLRGTTSVYGGTPKGLVVQRLTAAGCALHVAHTNADVAADGVSQALAVALGLVDTRPLVPDPAGPLDRITVHVPPDSTAALLDALTAAGAGRIGDYDRCGWWVQGTGTFRALPGATPTVGAVGQVETLAEDLLTVVAPRGRRADVIAALRAAHPYEEPAFQVVEVAPEPGPTGTGRVGRLAAPQQLAAFAQRVAEALPATPAGVRFAGDPQRLVEHVAVCGGSGDAYLAAARAAGVDAYVTADLRHHPASEHLQTLPGRNVPALVDPGHWASEWPWLDRAATVLADAFGPTSVETRVSTRVTDPWTGHVAASAVSSDRSAP